MRYRKEGARALGCSSVSRRRAMMTKKRTNRKSEIVPKASSERSRKIKKRSVCQLSLFFVSFRFCIGNFK